MHKLVHLPLAIIVAGGVLLLGATLWSHLKDRRDFWAEENAQTLTDAGLEYHGQACRMAHGDAAQDAKSQAAYEQAQARYGQFRETFSQAEERYERPKRLMWWSGMGCLAVGIVAYYLTRAVARE